MTHLLTRGAGSDRRPAARSGAARLAAAPVLLALLTGGCAVGGEEDAFSPTPRSDLAAKAEVGARNKAAKPDRARRAGRRDKDAGKGRSDRGRDRGTTGAARGAGQDSPDARSAGRDGSDDGTGSEPAGPTAAGDRVLVSADDRRGDHGLGADYGDLTGFGVVDTGDAARLTVTVAATIPARLADGEVMGVGVDVYRTDDRESDYQVFLDGGSDGWVAYLQTPRGFTRFPGSFSLAGNRLVVTVPWSALGGERDASVAAFVDWTNALAVGTNDAADRQPMATG